MSAEFIEYTLESGPGKGEKRPALVVRTNADGSQDLSVFTRRSDRATLTPSTTILPVEGYRPSPAKNGKPRKNGK